MTKIYSICLSILILYLAPACSHSQPGPESYIPEKNKEMNYSEVEIRVERGAFHYDTFIVTDSLVQFVPKEGASGKEEDKAFYSKSSNSIKKDDFVNLVDFILENGFWEAKDEYQENSSCTSGLKIQLKIGNQVKRVSCWDFQRGCPDYLYKIEQKVIKLHGKELYRKFLPG